MSRGRLSPIYFPHLIIPDDILCFYAEVATGRETMRGRQSWKLLAAIFAVFWMIFAAILIVSEFPFYVISIALTTIAMLSLLVIALAWAYTHDF